MKAADDAKVKIKTDNVDRVFHKADEAIETLCKKYGVLGLYISFPNICIIRLIQLFRDRGKDVGIDREKRKPTNANKEGCYSSFYCQFESCLHR